MTDAQRLGHTAPRAPIAPTIMDRYLVEELHADVNARDRRGVTVLANVMASGAADLADRLRSLGAN